MADLTYLLQVYMLFFTCSPIGSKHDYQLDASTFPGETVTIITRPEGCRDIAAAASTGLGHYNTVYSKTTSVNHNHNHVWPSCFTSYPTAEAQQSRGQPTRHAIRRKLPAATTTTSFHSRTWHGHRQYGF